MNSSPELVECKLFVTLSNSISESDELNQASELCPLKIGREQLAAVQKSDQSLRNCVEAAVDQVENPKTRVAFFWDNGILMRRWKSGTSNDEASWNTSFQIVLPSGYQDQVLKFTHKNVLAGHLGIIKTFKRVSKYFFLAEYEIQFFKVLSVLSCMSGGREG